jgi:hypothetical protein
LTQNVVDRFFHLPDRLLLQFAVPNRRALMAKRRLVTCI